MNKKKILIVTSEFPPLPGGIGSHAVHVGKQLYAQGYAVTVLADERSKRGAEEVVFDATLGFEVQRTKNRAFRGLMYFERILLLFKYIKTTDVVLASGKFSLWIVAFASLFYRRSYVAVIHGTEVNFKTYFLKKSIAVSLKRFSKIIAVSHFTQGLVQHLNLNTRVIPNGYDAELWQAEPLKHAPMTGYPQLITVGNVTKRKGQLEVIKKLPKLLERYPEIQYHCVGLPTETAAFKREAAALGVAAQVHFHGRLETAALQALLRTMDVFVMLSMTTNTGDVEGFGMALIEANALGIPTIGAKGCGIEEAVLEGQSGYLVAYDDDLEFINALERLLESPAFYKAHAMAWANKHSWDKIIKQYIEFMDV